MKLAAIVALVVVTLVALYRYLRDEVVTEDSGITHWRGRTVALAFVVLVSACASPRTVTPPPGDTCLQREGDQCRCWAGDYLRGELCRQWVSCDPAALEAARSAVNAPWVIGRSLVSERDAAWLRWFRAAEACGIDWRVDFRLRALPASVVDAFTTEPWFSIACGPWPDDWPECRELKRRMELR